MVGHGIGADNAQRGGPRRSRSLLRSGYRQPARHFGYTRCINRPDNRVSSCHDRCAANGEMDSTVIAGGGIAGLTQGLTGMLRAHSTVLTGGIGNPVIATAELGGALLISFLALAAPAAAIALVILFLLLAIRLLRRLFRGAKSLDSRT